jgi:filamentous hemagglutinin
LKKKGSFGSKKTQRDEVTDVKNIGSAIKTGGNLTLVSGGDQRYQGAKLNSGKDLTLDSGGSITFEAVKDLHQESHEKSSSDLAWQSAKGKGNTDETLRQSALTANGQTVINAVNGLNIDIKQIDQNTVSQTIDTMVQADPQLAWLKDAEKRGDVDWRQVKELHDSFKYSHSGLGQGAMLAIIIIVTVLTAGAASAAVGTAASATAGSGTAMAAASSTVAAGWGNVMASAALTSMASTGAVSVINNKGNLGLALKDTFSSDSLKNAAIGSLTAGAMSYADSNWFQSPSGATNGGSQVTSAGPIQNPGYSSDMLSWSNAEQTVLRSGTHALINSGISTAINGGSFGQNLGGALLGEGLDLAAAAGNKGIGDLAQELKVDPGTAQTIFLHAVLGGLISAAKGEGFASGAIAGGVAEGLTPKANEFLAQYVSENFNANDLSLQGSQDKIATAQIIGLLSAALAGGNPNTGSLIGGAGEKYNSELHHNDVEEADYELRKMMGEHIPQQEQDALGKIEPIDIMQGPHGGASPLGWGRSPIVGGSGSSGSAKSGVPGGDFTPNPNVTVPYSRPSGAGPNTAQRATVQGKPCVDCGVVTSNQVADHIDPLVVQYYRDGAVNVSGQSSVNAVQPHCPSCSASQGGQLGAFGKAMRKFFGF